MGWSVSFPNDPFIQFACWMIRDNGLNQRTYNRGIFYGCPTLKIGRGVALIGHARHWSKIRTLALFETRARCPRVSLIACAMFIAEQEKAVLERLWMTDMMRLYFSSRTEKLEVETKLRSRETFATIRWSSSYCPPVHAAMAGGRKRNQSAGKQTVKDDVRINQNRV